MNTELEWRPGTDPPTHGEPVLAWCGGELTGEACVVWYDEDDGEWSHVAAVWDHESEPDPVVTWWTEIPNPWWARKAGL